VVTLLFYFSLTLFTDSQDTSVVIVARPWAGQLVIGVQFLAFFSSRMDTEGYFSGVIAAGM
jgi:hypothetical protein